MKNILTIARFEITRLLLTRQGWLAIAAFALVWLLLVRFALVPISRYLSGSEGSVLLKLILSGVKLEYLLEWLTPQLAIYWISALYLLPIFCIVLTADQIASDRARGTLRFLHLRATREAIFFGRFLGQLLVQFLFILITIVTLVVLELYWGQNETAGWFNAYPVILINLIVVLMPYTALMAVMSVLAKSARQATLFAMIVWILFMFGLWFLRSKFPEITLFDWILPGSQISGLLKLESWNTLNLSPLPLIQTGVLLAVGWYLFRRINL